jgi:hypothetical protein
MSGSVRIGGCHQIAEPETVETLSESCEPRLECLSVVDCCEVSIRRTSVRLMSMAQNDPPRHCDNLNPWSATDAYSISRNIHVSIKISESAGYEINGDWDQLQIRGV